VGFPAGLMQSLEGDFAVTARVSYGGGKNTAVRVGVAGEFGQMTFGRRILPSRVPQREKRRFVAG
jgi:hypothetical protein